MTYRSVVISNPAYLKVLRLQLYVIVGDEQSTVPLEDIACIVLNHCQISLTGAVLSQCAEHNIVIISCDKSHLPNGVFYSYLPHSRQNLVLQQQLKLTLPFKKRLWQLIIKQKITNQAMIIANLGLSLAVNQRLLKLVSNVTSGDKQNNEAYASSLYFPALFGSGFIRITKNKPANTSTKEYFNINAMLNYAYTIVRSLMCRSLVAYGLLPTLGIFHDNQLNAFNLADDFIEPYRAYIDWYVYSIAMKRLSLVLDTPAKASLVDMLNHIIIIDNKSTTILNSIDVMVKSYVSCINEDDYGLIKLPQIPSTLERSNMD